VSTEVIRKGFEKCGIFDGALDFPVNRTKLKECNFDPEKLKRYKGAVKEKEPAPVPLRNGHIGADEANEDLENVDPAGLAIQIPVRAPVVSFENLLLKTVSPTPTLPPAKKRRIDNAEIITTESYLKKLELEKLEKAKVKPSRVTNPRKKKETAPKSKKRGILCAV
jgi:hypothetical protein